jgi:adenosylcobinamide-phosphate synthase
LDHAAALALALAIDLAFGEYPAVVHPVVWMGRCISFLEARAPRRGRLRQLGWGAMSALSVPLLFAVGACLVQVGCRRLGWVGIPLETLALKSTFSCRELGRAGARVRSALERGALGEARAGLRALCSRDASELDAPHVAAAAIESLGENASDSIVAPVFWFLVLGLPGAFAYRATNTLDARIGYHGSYEWLGKVAARLDDLWNLIPARLATLALLGAGLLCGANLSGGVRILLRDGGKTESPNAGRPMAALAGLLDVELEKVGHYRLGDAAKVIGPEQIAAAWRVVSVGAYLVIGTSVAVLGALDGPW